jgi:hypothetical protein
MRIALALLAITLAACSGRTRLPPLALPFPTDSVSEHVIADGVLYRSIRSPKGPWAIKVLDVDLSRCWSAVAVKGSPGAVGRKKTSVLLQELGATREVIGGVNADFFTLSGFLGVPTGTLISSGQVTVGPGPAPVLAIDSSGRPTARTLGVEGSITRRGETRRVAGWNRTIANGLNVYDARWNAALDTSTGIIEVTIEGGSRGRVTRIDTTPAGSRIPPGGSVIVAGRNAPEAMKQWLRSFAIGDTVQIALKVTPFHPLEAVGGRPILARDSVVAPEVETEGQASFRARNPRTAVGIANDGRRLILAVIDGRQAPYSDGMTLRETAELMLALGARDAINLDGGGSSALVYRDPTTKVLRVANKPSDATGERAVGDALGIVKGCGQRR